MNFNFQLIMDWKRWVICQETTGESLQCPANSKRKDAGAGYVSFIRNTQEFKKLGINVIGCELPVDENEAFEQTLLHNKASWHKSCRDLYNHTKLECANKRKLAEAAAEEIINEKEEEIPSSPVNVIIPKGNVFSVTNTIVLAIFILHRPLILTKKSESVLLF